MTEVEARYWADLITNVPSAVYPCWLLAEVRWERDEAQMVYVEHLGEVTQLLTDWSFAAKHEAWLLAEARWWAEDVRGWLVTIHKNAVRWPFPWEDA